MPAAKGEGVRVCVEYVASALVAAPTDSADRSALLDCRVTVTV